MIKTLACAIITIAFCSSLHAEEITRLNAGIYTKDEMSLGIATEAMWKKDYKKLE